MTNSVFENPTILYAVELWLRDLWLGKKPLEFAVFVSEAKRCRRKAVAEAKLFPSKLKWRMKVGVGLNKILTTFATKQNVDWKTFAQYNFVKQYGTTNENQEVQLRTQLQFLFNSKRDFVSEFEMYFSKAVFYVKHQ